MTAERMKMLDLRSDTVTHPTPEMYNAMMNAAVGDVVMGDDPTVNELERLGAELFGKEDCIFTASGTMSNQIAVFAMTERCDQIIAHDKSHIYNLERSGLAQISGVQVRAIKTEHGQYCMEELEKNLISDSIQSAPTTLICLESSFNLNDGLVLDPKHIQDVVEIAKKYGVKTYMDGARILNSCVSSGVEPKQMVEGIDAVALCLSKGLSCPIGSLLAGSREFINKAKKVRQMLGGGWRQGGVIAVCGIEALKDWQKHLEQDHEKAKDIISGVRSAERGKNIVFNNAETNIIRIDTSSFNMKAEKFAENMKDKGILVKVIEPFAVRIICHSDLHKKDIPFVIETILDCVGE